MDQVMATGLQVDALARGIGADQNAQRFYGRIGVEGALHILASFLASGTSEHGDAVVGTIGVVDRFP